MPEIDSTAVTKIYENTNLTVKARIDKRDLDSIEEVTFKFLKDGEQFEEQTIPMSRGKRSGDDMIVSHTVQAPAVPEDKDRYFLDYHYFYKVKSAASTESLQNFPSSRIQVFPRVAQLKVTDENSKAFSGFQFTVEQNGERSEVRKTFASATTNAKGESIPAGSAEFNLGLFPGFRIVPQAPYEIVEEVVGSGRKREIKGGVSFRAVFVAPVKGTHRQFVNSDVENLGQSGNGHEVTVEVGIDPEDLDSVRDKDAAEVHFRVTFGPADTDAAPKSKRADTAHPTKALKVSASDTTATVEEKEAGKKYEGKVTIKGAKFKVALGKAGGDTCKIEISGSAKFLTDTAISPDSTLVLENWRRVHYELMVPDFMQDQVLDAAGEGPSAARQFLPAVLQRQEALGRQLFIEFVNDSTAVFNARKEADYGALAPKSFLGAPEAEGLAYVLSGRNWRKLPANQMWKEEHPSKTLYIITCDALLKFRKDTQDGQKATDDFSGSLTTAAGSINVEEKFGGFFMPFSGFDSDSGITGIQWTADISKDDAVCKYTPALTIEEARTGEALPDGLSITVGAVDPRFPDMADSVEFARPPYPALLINNRTSAPVSGTPDDGKVTIKEPTLNKELVLSFVPTGDGKVTDTQGTELDSFFRTLFTDGKEQLRATASSNKFQLEVHGVSGEGGESARISNVLDEIDSAYGRTFEHDSHTFTGELPESQVEAIQGYVDELLYDPVLLREVQAKITVRIEGPVSTAHGEDECFNAVKNKLQELFDATKVEFASHPGLDEQAAPRQGTFGLADITDVLNENIEPKRSTFRQWHFLLPERLPNGAPGPGSFIGAAKTAEKCPVKIEFAVQAHEQSTGEVDGKLIAWVADPVKGASQLLRLMLQAFSARTDSAAVAHGHGDGNPGDCLAESNTLCAACIDFGRSKDLTAIG
jgi:hypothetical protein